MKQTIDQLIKISNRFSLGKPKRSEVFHEKMINYGITASVIEKRKEEISPEAFEMLKRQSFMSKEQKEQKERQQLIAAVKEKNMPVTVETSGRFFIDGIAQAPLSVDNQYKCSQCNYINTATKYALKMLDSGNIHISSCKSCNKRYNLKLNKN